MNSNPKYRNVYNVYSWWVKVGVPTTKALHNQMLAGHARMRQNGLAIQSV